MTNWTFLSSSFCSVPFAHLSWCIPENSLSIYILTTRKNTKPQPPNTSTKAFMEEGDTTPCTGSLRAYTKEVREK